MEQSSLEQDVIDPASRDFYCAALDVLAAARVPFLVGGAYAYGYYTGIHRHTKDFDLFVRPADIESALAALRDAGYKTELTMQTWIGKAFQGESFVDLIFNGSNGLATVDDEWFTHAGQGTILDRPVQICPIEEMIWSKAFVINRERYDGGDIAHLLRAHAGALDWDRLLRRFDAHWEVLLSHLILFRFIYPGERDKVPRVVMESLLDRVREQVELPAPTGRICRGTLLSRTQYLIDTEQWGYRDGRLRPQGALTAAEVDELNATTDK
jgi:putative nucleotidyltransferase-like protein